MRSMSKEFNIDFMSETQLLNFLIVRGTGGSVDETSIIQFMKDKYDAKVTSVTIETVKQNYDRYTIEFAGNDLHKVVR